MANVCPICNNPLRQYGNDFYVCEVCETYFDKNENIVLTEQEWLQTADTEQLADAIYDLLIDRQWDSWSWKLNGMVLRDIHEHGNTKSTKAIMEWLKQPHMPKE